MMSFNPTRRLSVTISIDAAKALVRAAKLYVEVVDPQLSSVERRLVRQVIDSLNKHIAPYLKQPRE